MQAARSLFSPSTLPAEPPTIASHNTSYPLPTPPSTGGRKSARKALLLRPPATLSKFKMGRVGSGSVYLIEEGVKEGGKKKGEEGEGEEGLGLGRMH